MDAKNLRLPPDKLRWQCDAECFKFECTDELTPLQEFIGQERAIGAIEFGLGVDQPGYNIFLTGMTGTGKATVISAHLEQLVAAMKRAGQAATPSDWVYVHNFFDSDRPRIMELPTGGGRQVKQRLERLQEGLQREIAAVFASEEYQGQHKEIGEEQQAVQRKIFQELEQSAEKDGFSVQFSPVGVALIPLKAGKPASQEDYLALSDKGKRSLETKRVQVMRRVEESMEKVRGLERAAREKLSELDHKVAEFVTGAVFGEAKKDLAAFAPVQDFLDQLRLFTIERIDAFRAPDEQAKMSALFQEASKSAREREVLLPFVVNVFVDNAGQDGPPIVVENNPTFSNLFGKIDRRFLLGGYVTDHTMLKAGSIQKANGGYLVVNMRNVIMNPLVWDALKRAIRTKESHPEDPAEALGMMVPRSVRPEAMPLHVKVVATGDPTLYHLLAAHDEDFWETFKVRADFDWQISRSPAHMDAYAQFICRTCNEQKLRHFSRDGVAKVLEYTARLVADQRKLSTRFGLVRDLLIEAEYWAGKDGKTRVAGAHVQKAAEQRIFRSNLISERLQGMITDGTIMVDVAGAAAGQVNGLAVYDTGDLTFGKPSRITARTFTGRGGIVNIEREAKLSGSTHDKGILILSGYLGWKYAQERPLSLTATIAFEQSYEGVDGDSASSTELYALLSSISDAPLRQDLAVTGSVNQKGEVQAIGGVNQKVEGFYDVCAAMGLNGSQGVLIPKHNVVNLMLREDVVEAVRRGKFHIYAVGTIDEGIELLTGVPAGERNAKGAYPKGTINYLVEQRLRGYAETQRQFSQPGQDSASKKAGEEEAAGAPRKKQAAPARARR
ncbi:MAG: hypothetical protein EXR49_04620 [Dehalococcoidia bacterium]|nr:hypothetical protein [Dehalococcoidia bacterium]